MRRIAERWHCSPMVVERAPWYHVQNELDFMRIESEAAAARKQRGN